MKILVAVLMLVLASVAFAQDGGGVSKATAAYSTACEQLQNAEAAEKENDVGNAIIAYRFADESFSRARNQDPSYQTQNVIDSKKTIAEAIGRLNRKLQSPEPPKKQEPLLTTMKGHAISLLISLLVSFLAIKHYKNKYYRGRAVYHTFWPRFFAGFVDSCVLWPATILTVIMDGKPHLAVAAVAGVLIGNMTCWCYTVIMQAKYGQTLGKMACRVKVVDAKTGDAITFRQALLRQALPIAAMIGVVGLHIYALWTRQDPSIAYRTGSAYWIIAGVPTIWLLAEVITMFANERRRALHDYIAGTVVLRTNTIKETDEEVEESEKGRVLRASYDY